VTAPVGRGGVGYLLHFSKPYRHAVITSYHLIPAASPPVLAWVIGALWAATVLAVAAGLAWLRDARRHVRGRER
jgi:hypothetical protein